MTLYNWAFFLHILFGFIFFFVHGVSMATAVFLPREKNIDKIKMLLELPSITIAPMGVSLLVLLITSIYLGSSAQWWARGWWGVSFLIFLVLVVWMTWYSRKYYSPIRKALGLEYMTGFGTHNKADENKSVNMDEVYNLIAKTNPALLGAVGIIALAILLFLMRFKPF